jgi:AraC family transcriptional activator of pyochelin receptor
MPIHEASERPEEESQDPSSPESTPGDPFPDSEALQASGNFSSVLFTDDNKEFCIRMSNYFISVKPGWDEKGRESRIMQLQFVLKGDLHFRLKNSDTRMLAEGQYTMYDMPSIGEINWFHPQNQHTTTLDVYFTPKYLKKPISSFPVLAGIMYKRRGRRSNMKMLLPGTVTPKIMEILRDIVDCRYMGGLRQLYIHCKVSELTLYALERMHLGPIETQYIHLKEYDVEKLHESREYLMRHMEDPPTLKQLAHKMGINDFKLKKGYKQLFGTTIFGDFHRARMEKAKQWLSEAKKSIMEVALSCGYKDASNFSRAFKEFFGETPGRTQKNSGLQLQKQV